MSKFAKALSTKHQPSAEEKIKIALDDDSYKDFMEAMKSPGISSGAIHKALRDLGVEISVMTIQRWRQK
jgi:hypothetical protein